jgi:hypothetical protein
VNACPKHLPDRRDATAVLKPRTMLLIGTGVIGLLGWLRRRKMK